MDTLNSELFLVDENDPKLIQFEFLLRPTMEFSNGCEISTSESVLELHRNEQQEEQEEEGRKEEKSEINAVHLKEQGKGSLGEFKVDDDDDGFRTPTSEDHKIPVVKKCPPAPRKPKPYKRKSPSNTHLKLKLDLPKGIESMFPPILTDVGRKIKKARGSNDTK